MTEKQMAMIERLATIRTLIARAERDFERVSGSVTLVAVSKTFGPGEIRPVLEAGQRVFGENRVQEAKAKWPDLRAAFDGIDLHLIGPLQSNKAREAVELFDCIETLDRVKLAGALREAIDKAGRAPRLFVQINTGAEDQKAGVLPVDADRFIAECRETYGLTIDGLMCIPPVEDPPSPHFALMNVLARRNGISNLSMGMSADFEPAIQLGASHVRIGSAIFGSRGTFTV